MKRSQRYAADPAIRVLNGICPHDCPDSCGWQVAIHKDSGRALDIWGNPDHPVAAGRLCGKVDRYLERSYHPDRLTRPLRRIGPKGSGQFEPITWDEALRAIGDRLTRIVAEQGAEAVLPYSYCGTMGLLQGEGMAARFFHRMGASRLARTICSEAGFEGYVYTIGATEGIEPAAFAEANLILIWGSNTLTSNVHLWPYIQQARKQGARVIVIDPAQTRTARVADEWIPIRPGTDGALALAMMNVLIGRGLHDMGYVERYTLGFDALAARVAAWSPQRAAEITGVPAARIQTLAVDYATTRPAVIRINYGLQRHRGGGMAVRTIACLPALVGAWRDVGGGIQLSTSGAFRHMDLSGLQRPDLLASRRPRVINMNRLGHVLSHDPADIAQAHYHPRPVDPIPDQDQAGPTVAALIVYNSNPAAVAAEQAAVRRGLSRADLFTVVLEQFLTDTADYADYVLPATTQLEHWDLVQPYGHLYLGLNRPAIPPLDQSAPNSEIFRRLAAVMGYDDPCFAEDDETILRNLVEAQEHARFSTVTWKRLLEHGYARLRLPNPYRPFARGRFPTPSGKCEFYSERMARDGYDPLPAFTPPRWLKEDPGEADPGQDPLVGDATGMLVCISPPAHSFLNSSFANLARFRTREGEPVLWIHAQDAARRAIQDGDQVRVGNALGQVQLTARVTTELIPGTVLAPGVWWAKYSPDGRNINQVTDQGEADMGAGALFYDTLVQVQKEEKLCPTYAASKPSMMYGV